MECPNCNKSMIDTDKIIAEFYICETCNYETIKYPSTCCFWQKNEPVKYYKDETELYKESEDYLVYNQCKSCGRKNGQALKKSDYKKLN